MQPRCSDRCGDLLGACAALRQDEHVLHSHALPLHQDAQPSDEHVDLSLARRREREEGQGTFPRGERDAQQPIARVDESLL